MQHFKWTKAHAVYLPQVDAETDLSEPYRLMLAGHGGVIVTRNGGVFGFVPN